MNLLSAQGVKKDQRKKIDFRDKLKSKKATGTEAEKNQFEGNGGVPLRNF